MGEPSVKCTINTKFGKEQQSDDEMQRKGEELFLTQNINVQNAHN